MDTSPRKWALRLMAKRWRRALAAYAPGLFDSVEAVGEREGDGVALVFRGAPRMFIGVVSVDGARGATVNTQLQRASRLNSGTRYTKKKMGQAIAQMTCSVLKTQASLE